jgi:hypothetical protein
MSRQSDKYCFQHFTYSVIFSFSTTLDEPIIVALNNENFTYGIQGLDRNQPLNKIGFMYMYLSLRQLVSLI